MSAGWKKKKKFYCVNSRGERELNVMVRPPSVDDRRCQLDVINKSNVASPSDCFYLFIFSSSGLDRSSCLFNFEKLASNSASGCHVAISAKKS